MTAAIDYEARGLVAPTRRPAIPGGGPQTVADLLDRVLAKDPEREALVGRDGRYTYAELDAAVNRAAAALAGMGVAAGDRVAMSLPNSAEIVVAFLGSMRLGAIWLGINRALAPPEKAYMLTDAQASVFLGDSDMVAQVASERAKLPDLRELVAADPGDASSAWAQALAACSGASRPDVEIDPFAPGAIAYTSGTTGFPKGAVHSQHNIMLPGASALLHNEDSPGFKSGVCLPLTLLNLMVLGPALVYQAGGCLVAMDRVDAVGLAAWIRTERVNSFSVVPAIIHDLLTHPDVGPDDLASVTRPGVGGADCPELTRRLYRERFGREVTVGYGLTEAPTSVTHTNPEAPPVEGSCGTALPFVAVRVCGPDGDELPRGEIGEVCVGPAEKGAFAGVYTTMLGYWNRPEATVDALKHGMLYTGDLGSMSEDGHLTIRDRRSELILRGGANVYPAEVERVLANDPRIAACAVLGVADERLGERVVAVVQLALEAKADAEELTAFCGAQLARYKIPSEFVFVADFPRTPMGKIRKRDLRGLFEA
ncbi:MAG: AMP-binding protein [Myxococcales bacterium]|nr:AMP-binding protein [Myxococcales bacterium]